LIYQRIRGYFYNKMRYINLRFTYLLTYNTDRPSVTGANIAYLSPGT